MQTAVGCGSPLRHSTGRYSTLPGSVVTKQVVETKTAEAVVVKVRKRSSLVPPLGRPREYS